MPSTSRSLSTVSAKKSKEVDYVTLDSDDEDIIVPPSGKKLKIGTIINITTITNKK